MNIHIVQSNKQLSKTAFTSLRKKALFVIQSNSTIISISVSDHNYSAWQAIFYQHLMYAVHPLWEPSHTLNKFSSRAGKILIGKIRILQSNKELRQQALLLTEPTLFLTLRHSVLLWSRRPVVSGAALKIVWAAGWERESSLLCRGETTFRILCPILGSLVQERLGASRESSRGPQTWWGL